MAPTLVGAATAAITDTALAVRAKQSSPGLRAARPAYRGCAPPAVSASCCQRPGAGHPWPALRTPPVRGTGSGLHRLRNGGQRRSRLGESGSATTHASRQCPAVLATGSPQQSDPSRMQGGWPEPAMDGRRPELGAGQRRFRLVIPPASATGTAPPHPAPRKLEMNQKRGPGFPGPPISSLTGCGQGVTVSATRLATRGENGSLLATQA